MGICKFFPIKDCPAIIEVFGDRETRIKLLELYINDDCEFIGCDDNAIADGIGNIITDSKSLKAFKGKPGENKTYS